ncbi:hypothetical protein [Nocardia sp. NPDC052112]|uniref:hypothetical protein n=1 Tax=Nocardia sp. NPDC052112 TaxID=3155646 RepID=UPI003414D0C6
MASDAITTRLRAVAGPQLYQHNAFRITGVPTDADRPFVRNRRQLVVAAAAAGADIDLGDALPVSEAQARAAFDVLLDSRHRLIDEVFWLWGSSVTVCGCVARLHRDHDSAVRKHSAALDSTHTAVALGDTELLRQQWSDAAQSWRTALRRTAFWDHLRHRIAALDDRGLDASVIDQLRAEVPVALLKSLILLVVSAPERYGWLVDEARAWPVPEQVVDDEWEQAAEPWYQSADNTLTAAFPLLHQRNFPDAAALVEGDALADLRRLEIVVPSAKHRRTATLRNQAAVLLNNCALGILDNADVREVDLAETWFDMALDLTTDPQSRATIVANSTEVRRARLRMRTRKRAKVSQDQVRDRARQRLQEARAERIAREQRWREERERWARELREREAKRRQRVERRRRARQELLATLLRSLKQALRAGQAVALGNQRSRGVSGYGGPLGGFVEHVRFDRVAVAVFVGTAIAVLCALAMAGLVVRAVSADPASGTVNLFAARVSDNAPIGTCIATRESWDDDKSAVRVVDCVQPHWGEVLGYPALAPVPAPYPGDDQVGALARFRCRLLIAGQGLDESGYVASNVAAPQQDWNTGGKQYQNYAACVVHRVDDSTMVGRTVDPSAAHHASVPMPLYAGSAAQAPPVGSCIESRGDYDGWLSSRIADVAVVGCESPHWGEVLDYPVVASLAAPWPGQDVVLAAVRGSCARIALPPGFDFWNLAPAQSWWDPPHRSRLGVCIAARVDGNSTTGSVR